MNSTFATSRGSQRTVDNGIVSIGTVENKSARINTLEMIQVQFCNPLSSYCLPTLKSCKQYYLRCVLCCNRKGLSMTYSTFDAAFWNAFYQTRRE